MNRYINLAKENGNITFDTLNTVLDGIYRFIETAKKFNISSPLDAANRYIPAIDALMELKVYDNSSDYDDYYDYGEYYGYNCDYDCPDDILNAMQYAADCCSSLSEAKYGKQIFDILMKK